MESFYNGKVFYTLADAAFSPTTVFSNMISILNMAKKDAIMDKMKVLCVLTDGGADHNVIHSSVQVAIICVSILLDVDLSVFMRTIPGHSWANIVERVMAIFNIALYHSSLKRPLMDDRAEETMSKCSGLNEVREAGQASSHFKSQLQTSMGTVADELAIRFNRLSLKGEPFKRLPIYNETMVHQFLLKAREIDPALDFSKLTRKDLQRKDCLHAFLEAHLTCHHYWVMFTKCKVRGCICGPVQMPLDLFDEIVAKGFPEPQPDESRPGHYLSFEKAYGKVIDPSKYVSRPSLDSSLSRSIGNRSVSANNKDLKMGSTFVHGALRCVECNKPRYAPLV